MKVGVVTNYDMKNYGSVLQAYALQQKLTELGAESYVLQKRTAMSRSLPARAKRFFSNSGNQYSIREKNEIRKARKAFSEKNKKLARFCSNHIQVRTCASLDGAAVITGDTDVLLAGSDQIWSPRAEMLSQFTLLQFGAERIKRYSYAASVGVEQLSDEAGALIREGLEAFSGISVRESSSVNLLKQYSAAQIHADVDPTFLYDSSFWSQHTAELDREGYIFVYMLRPEPLTMQMAKSLAEKTGLKICCFSNRIIEDECVENITNAGLEEFLAYIKNASYVVTNSFHGTAFSVQFHKAFMSVAVSGTGIRVRDFLTMAGLQQHIAEKPEDIDRIFEVQDWTQPEAILSEQRNRSIEYLKEILRSSEESAGQKEIVLYRDKFECSGCGACRNICPRNAISMEKDEHGFCYPKIDPDQCIRCGLCKKVCAYQNGTVKQEVKRAVAAVACAEETRMKSASGGAFAAIAKSFLNDGGVVFGCEMQRRPEGLTPAHTYIESIDELYRLQSSKYAQSDIGMAYSEVKQFLTEGRKVLFSGTPCQIAGLRGYLQNRSYENLYTIDLICHGVPSAEILQGYLQMLEKKHSAEVTGINFRNKKYGWGVKGNYYLKKADGKETSKYFDSFSSSFYYLYLKAAFYRDNCYSCRYANLNRTGDITVGDFWGVGVQQPKLLLENGGEWNVDQGISCILVNGEQGERLLSEYGEYLECKDTTVEKIIFKNKMLQQPSKLNGNRAGILKQYEQGGYEAVDQWFRKKLGMKTFLYGKWDKIPPETRSKIKNIKKLLR